MENLSRVNRIELLDENQPSPSHGNTFDPKMLPGKPFLNDGVMKSVDYFSYYNPYLKKRVVVKEFNNDMPFAYEPKYIDILAIDHYVQEKRLILDPEYTLIGRITQLLMDRGYNQDPKPEKIKDVKMQLDRIHQPKVDAVAALLIKPELAENLNLKIVLHSIRRSLQKPRFELKGGKKTRRNSPKRKTRGRKYKYSRRR